MRSDVWAAGQNRVIDGLLYTCPAIVASFESALDEVVGWVCRDVGPSSGRVHYVYTKLPYRRIGVAGVLVSGVERYSHYTRAGELLFRKHGALYDPFLLWSP